jgi:outer membrane protein assembly factor BamB
MKGQGYEAMRANTSRGYGGLRIIPALILITSSLFAATASAQSSDWAQWGGPHRNFTSDVKGLPPAWPESGPRRLWSRELGDGYSAIAAAGGKLYTMYRRGEADVVICMQASTGKTLWEFAYPAPFSKDYDMTNGPGPHATPLVSGDKVFAAGATGKLHCLNKDSGKLIWARDLLGEFEGNIRVNGYSCSPVAYKNTIIMMVGGAGASIMAFNQADGSVAWKKHDFKNSTCSPLIINVGGQDQLVAFMFSDIVGLDPATGGLLWSHPHVTDFGLNTSLPVWGEDNLLFVSSGYNGGSRVIKLTREGDKTVAQELWANRLMRVHFGTVIRLGDYVYGSSGDFGPAPFTAVNVKSGQVVWRDRSLARASFIYADGRFILLDEDGHLAMATPSPEGLKVQAKVELLANNSWTVPTLAGTVLYVRDRKTVQALDLK